MILQRVETRRGFRFGVLLGTERGRPVYAVEEAWRCAEWRGRLEAAGRPVRVEGVVARPLR